MNFNDFEKTMTSFSFKTFENFIPSFIDRREKDPPVFDTNTEEDNLYFKILKV